MPRGTTFLLLQFSEQFGDTFRKCSLNCNFFLENSDNEENQTNGTLKGTIVDANSTIYRRNSYNVITRKDELLNGNAESETRRVTKTIEGDNTAVFEGLPKEEGENEIEYIVEEVEIEKRSSTDSDDWQQVEPDTFKYTQVEATVMDN